MKKKLTVMCDVDGTIVDNVSHKWGEWYLEKTGVLLTTSDLLNMPTIFSNPNLAKDYAIDPRLYWYQHDLYDNIDLFPGVSSWFDILHNNYDLEVIFVSCCIDAHLESKFNFIKRNFANLNYHFVNTCPRHFIHADIILEDNNEQIIKHIDNCRFKRPRYIHIDNHLNGKIDNFGADISYIYFNWYVDDIASITC